MGTTTTTQKKEFNLKKYRDILFIMIGFLLITLDWSISTGIQYPNAYQNSSKVIGAYQCFTIEYLYGADWEEITVATEDDGTAKIIGNVQYEKTGIRLDIFNDVVGYALVLLGCVNFRKKSKPFNLAILSAAGAIILGLVIELLPFVMNGLQLCNVALLLGIAQVGIGASVMYFVMCGMCDILEDVAFRGDRRALSVSWFLNFILNIIVVFCTWLMLSYYLVLVYNMILFAVTLFFLFKIYNLRDFIMGDTVR